MPLFAVKVRIEQFEEIPVFANSEEDALAYAMATEEWKEDGGLMGLSGEMTVIAARSILQIGGSPFEPDTLCWNPGNDGEMRADDAVRARWRRPAR